MAKMTISIPDDLKKEYGDYNKANPYRKINISQIAQHGLHLELKKRKKESEGIIHEHN